MTARTLYIWLDGDPVATPPDTAIEDVPGVSDLTLVAEAIAAGRLGRYLPAKLSISPHERPSFSGYRRIDVGKLLRDRQIPHRQRFEVLSTTAPDSGERS